MHLAKLINGRLSTERRLQDLDEAAKRLRETQASEQQALSELNVLNDAEAAAMAKWSRDPDGVEPQPDLTKREALEGRLRSATAKANSARHALGAIQSDQAREHATLAKQKLEIQHAVAAVIVDEALGASLDDLRQAVQVAVQKQERLRQAVQAVFTIAHHGGALDDMKPVFDLASKLDDDLRKAVAPPPPDGSPAFASWMKLATELQKDPLAQLS